MRNTDLFCIADYPHHAINVEILKSPPEPDNKKLASWKCLGLLETLLNLLENGGLYSQVQELLKEPVQHCPDVLVLGLLQLTQPMTKLRQELLSSLIPVFLGNHPNSAIILHHVWHAQSPLVKPLVMHAMAEWYMRAEHDQARLSRILDVAQDLKALSMLLNVQRFPFVIDLSCLASRREYLKLDKWLTDKMREHGETFVAACVNFLHQRCPQISGKVKEEAGLKPTQLPSDTLAIMLSCLQVCFFVVYQIILIDETKILFASS
jgi:CCR4-NOT transcription complex subunit 1